MLSVSSTSTQVNQLFKKIPRTAEDIKKLNKILLDPRLVQLAENNPKLREEISRMIVRLKAEKELERRRQSRSAVDSAWLKSYLATLPCIGWIPVRKAGGNRIQQRMRKKKCTSSKSATVPTLTKVVAPGSKPMPPEKTQLPLEGVMLKEVKVRLESGVTVQKRIDPQKSTKIIEALLKDSKLDATTLSKVLLVQPTEKVSLIFDQESFNCSDKKSVSVLLNPMGFAMVEEQKTATIRYYFNVSESNEATGTQYEYDDVESCKCTCDECSHNDSVDLKSPLTISRAVSSPTLNSYSCFYDNEENVRMVYPSTVYTNPDTKNDDDSEVNFCCGSVSNSTVGDVLTGGRYLAEILKESDAPKTDLVTPDAVVSSSSVDANKDDNNKLPEKYYTNYYKTTMEGQLPPEISSGYSQIYVKDDSSDERLSLGETCIEKLVNGAVQSDKSEPSVHPFYRSSESDFGPESEVEPSRPGVYFSLPLKSDATRECPEFRVTDLPAVPTRSKSFCVFYSKEDPFRQQFGSKSDDSPYEGSNETTINKSGLAPEEKCKRKKISKKLQTVLRQGMVALSEGCLYNDKATSTPSKKSLKRQKDNSDSKNCVIM